MLSGQQRLPLHNTSPQQLVVFLHGYGSNGQDLISLADVWANDLPQVEFLAPNAPDQNPFNPYGYQWFGLEEITPFNIRQGLDRAGPILAKYLKEQLHQRHLSYQDLILVGFSQGTMLALEMAFLIPEIGGILGYSGAFVPPLNAIPFKVAPEIVLVHGMADTVVPYGALAEAQRNFNLLGVNVMTHSRPGVAHFIDQYGLEIGREFIKHRCAIGSDIIYLKGEEA